MFQVKRENLNAVLDILTMVPEKLGISASEYIWVRGQGSHIKMSVSSYISGEVELDGVGSWPFKDNFYLDRRTFVPWVMSARESKDKHRFQFHRRGDRLFLKHGGRTVTFDNQKKISGYGDLKRIKGLRSNPEIPVSDELKEMLKCGNNCAVADTIQPQLNCVLVSSKGSEVFSYAASDYVFYVGKGTLSKNESIDTVPFPLFLINLLTIKGLKRISCVGKYVLLKFKNGTIWQPISEEANTNFPLDRIKKYARQARSLPVTFSTSGRRFSRMMVRLGYYLQSVRRRDWVVVVKGERGDDTVMLRSSIPGVHFRERISVSGGVPKDFKIEWPLATLAPVFEFLSKRTKKMPLVVRINHKSKISYVQAGKFWLCVPSRQEEI
jgi:hypothetical protein